MAYANSGSAEETTGKKGKDDLLVEARKRYHLATEYEQRNWDEALDDLRFLADDQWPEEARRMREPKGKPKRPCLTINLTRKFVRSVTGEIRMNRPAIKVRPADDASDKDLAKVFTGIIRNIEIQSKAQQSAYITAAHNAAACGMGHFRIVTEYSDNDGFEQDIRIKRIRNPFAVVWDPGANELTKRDANYCFFVERMPKEEFKAKFPKASTTDFEIEGQKIEFLTEWFDTDSIRVAEYWVKKPVKKKLALMQDGKTLEVTDANKAEIEAQQPKRYRDVQSHKVVQYLINGSEILEGPTDWPGKDIPIIPVIGEEVYVGEEVVRSGIVRNLKDPQRMYNYHASAAVETIALSPKAPFIGTVDQFEGQEKNWEQANTLNLAYLAYNRDGDAPAPQRQQPPTANLASIQMAQMSADNMKDTSGIYDAGLGARSNETSGKAILARKQEGDIGSYVYTDNLALAIGYAGEILVDIIPQIYDTERVIRVLGEDDSAEFVAVNQLDPMTGELINDLSAGEYDVTVETGPSFSTKRQEAQESMLQFLQSAPETAALAMDLLVKNFDWPGADTLAERFKKTLPPGIAEPDPNEPPAEPPPPPPEVIAQQQQAQVEAEQKDREFQIKNRELDIKEREVNQKGLEQTQNFQLQRGQANAQGGSVGDVSPEGQPMPSPLDQLAMALSQMAEAQAQASTMNAQALEQVGIGLQQLALSNAAPRQKQINGMLPSGQPFQAIVTEVGNA